jgi:hypothetical protein
MTSNSPTSLVWQWAGCAHRSLGTRLEEIPQLTTFTSSGFPPTGFWFRSSKMILSLRLSTKVRRMHLTLLRTGSTKPPRRIASYALHSLANVLLRWREQLRQVCKDGYFITGICGGWFSGVEERFQDVHFLSYRFREPSKLRAEDYKVKENQLWNMGWSEVYNTPDTMAVEFGLL